MKIVAHNEYRTSFDIIRDNGEVYKCNIVHHNKINGKEYIYIPLFTKTDIINGYAYSCRLIDQVNQIRNGEGDYIAVGSTFDKILYYLDREYGEEVRQRTLDGFKDFPTDATGKYFIYVLHGLTYYYGIDRDFHAISRKEEVDPMLFESDKDADDYIQKLTKNLESECARIDKEEINTGDISRDLKMWAFSCRIRTDKVYCNADVGQWVL